MGATIKDVARETNLAISTISKYLNGGTVRKRNKKAIDEAIKKLNYSPNTIARGLRTSRTYRVGLMNGAGSTPHIAALLGEIENCLRKQGYSLMYINNENCDEECDREYIDFMIENGVDGIIATSSGNQLDYIKKARETQIPVVTMEESCIKAQTDCVQVDGAGGAYGIVEYLINAGHKKIAIINGPMAYQTAGERLKGYRRVMEDYNIAVDEKYIVNGGYTYEGGYAAIKELWQLQDRPSAVFVANYNMCVGAMKAIYELGIHVPEELSVVSFDDSEFSLMVQPRLTAVCQPLKELADTACELLLRRMNGDFSDYPRRIRLKTEYKYRDSVLKIHDSEHK